VQPSAYIPIIVLAGPRGAGTSLQAATSAALRHYGSPVFVLRRNPIASLPSRPSTQAPDRTLRLSNA
jgi:hypothetical protein